MTITCADLGLQKSTPVNILQFCLSRLNWFSVVIFAQMKLLAKRNAQERRWRSSDNERHIYSRAHSFPSTYMSYCTHDLKNSRKYFHVLHRCKINALSLQMVHLLLVIVGQRVLSALRRLEHLASQVIAAQRKAGAMLNHCQYCFRDHSHSITYSLSWCSQKRLKWFKVIGYVLVSGECSWLHDYMIDVSSRSFYRGVFFHPKPYMHSLTMRGVEITLNITNTTICA